MTTTGDVDCMNGGRGGGVNNEGRNARRGGVNDTNGRTLSVVGRGIIIGPVYIVTGLTAGGTDTAATARPLGSDTAALSLRAGCGVGSGTAARPLGCGVGVG